MNNRSTPQTVFFLIIFPAVLYRADGVFYALNDLIGDVATFRFHEDNRTRNRAQRVLQEGRVAGICSITCQGSNRVGLCAFAFSFGVKKRGIVRSIFLECNGYAIFGRSAKKLIGVL